MSTETALIIRNDSRREIAFTDQAKAIKSAALEKSALIAKVNTAEEQETAVEAQRELATIVRNVEAARVAAKAPILAFGKLIDDQAKTFAAELAEEQMRISTLVGSYQQLVAAKAAAEEHARRLEAERIEREQREEQQRILRAEQERLAVIRCEQERLAREQAEREAAAKCEADEADRVIREAANAEARKKAEAAAKEQKRLRDIADARAREEAERAEIELKRQQELAAAKTHEDLDAAQERASNAQASIAFMPASAPVRADGQRVRHEWEISVDNSFLLCKFHPQCVTIKPILTEIKDLLNQGVTVHGITAKKIVTSSVMTRRSAPAIEV